LTASRYSRESGCPAGGADFCPPAVGRFRGNDPVV